MEKLIEFSPAYDRRDPDPKKNYGIGSVIIKFILKGEEGAVQFALLTDWFLPETQRAKPELSSLGLFSRIKPSGYDLGYHAISPRGEYQSDDPPEGETDYTTPSRECQYTSTGRCFYDGSSLNADPMVETLLREGHDGVWRVLEEYYRDTFPESLVLPAPPLALPASPQEA